MPEGSTGDKAAFFTQDAFKKDETKTTVEPVAKGSVGDKAAWLTQDAFKKEKKIRLRSLL